MRACVRSASARAAGAGRHGGRMLMTAQQSGVASGVAVIGAVLYNRLGERALTRGFGLHDGTGHGDDAAVVLAATGAALHHSFQLVLTRYSQGSLPAKRSWKIRASRKIWGHPGHQSFR